MKKITHISVGPDHEAEPEDPPRAVYVESPEPDALEEKPFATGRHRIERTPEGDDDKPAATLWSWTEGDG